MYTLPIYWLLEIEDWGVWILAIKGALLTLTKLSSSQNFVLLNENTSSDHSQPGSHTAIPIVIANRLALAN